MIASIIAYFMTGFFALVSISGLAQFFKTDDTKLEGKYLVVFVVCGFLAWLCAYLGGI